MQAYEEHTQISEDLSNLQNYILKKYAISSDLVDIISEYALNLYTVVKIKPNNMVLDNTVYINNEDYKDCKLKIGKLILNAEHDPDMKKEEIAMNRYMRQQLDLELADIVSVVPVRCKFPKIEVIKIKIRIPVTDRISPGISFHINNEEFTKYFFKLYKNQVFRKDQKICGLYKNYIDIYQLDVFSSHCNTPINLILFVENVDLQNLELLKPKKYIRICKGILSKSTKIVFESGTSILKIIF